MDAGQHCPECDAPWAEGSTCLDHFYQMGVWDFENPSFIPEVHHLCALSVLFG